MKILLIDDDQDSILNLKDGLELGGHECAMYLDPRKGLNAFKKDNYDMVITDFKMPDLNGIEIVKKLRSYNPRAYVVLVTGYATLDIAVDALNEGASGFFRKPMEFDKFIYKIKDIEKKVQIEKKLDENNRRLENSLEQMKKDFNYLENIIKKYKC